MYFENNTIRQGFTVRSRLAIGGHPRRSSMSTSCFLLLAGFLITFFAGQASGMELADWPVYISGPTQISSDYGPRYVDNPEESSIFHKGLDFAVDQNTPVHACVTGTVDPDRYGWHDKIGNRVWVKGTGGTFYGYEFLYAHLNSISVARGTADNLESVEPGTEIGLSGAPPNTTEYHLHFGVTYGGEYYNPMQFFSNYTSVAPTVGARLAYEKKGVMTPLQKLSGRYVINRSFGADHIWLEAHIVSTDSKDLDLVRYLVGSEEGEGLKLSPPNKTQFLTEDIILLGPPHPNLEAVQQHVPPQYSGWRWYPLTDAYGDSVGRDYVKFRFWLDRWGEGEHTIWVEAETIKGKQNFPESMVLLIDRVDPTTTLSVDPPDGLNGWYITVPTILLWPNETATIYYHWDDQPDEEYTAGALTAPEGIHALYFHAVDQAGNVETEQQREFKVDTHTETSSLSISPSSPDGNFFWYRTVPTITLSATGGASIYYHWNFEPDVSYASPFMAPEGSNWLYFHCEDQAGNIESSNMEFIKVDSIPPSMVIDSVATWQDQATVYWSGTDGTSGIDYYEVRLDGGAWVYTVSSREYTFTDLSNGQHTAFVRAYDTAGNSAEDSRSFNIDVQANPPQVTINPLGHDRTNQTTVTIAGSASDADTGGQDITSVEYQVDGTGGAWSAATISGSGRTVDWNATVGPLSPNTGHTIFVRASDPTYTSYPVAYSFFVDTVAPQVVSARSLGNTLVEISFDEEVDPTSAADPAHYAINELAISDAAVQPDGRFVHLTTSSQEYGQFYTVTVTGVADLAGNVITTNNQATFTGLPAGAVVISTWPTDGSTGIPTNAVITATFNTDMEPTSVNESTFLLTVPAGQVSGVVSYDVGSRVASFTPSEPLAEVTTYTAMVTSGCLDTGGNPLLEDYTWSFVTGTEAGFGFNWTVNVTGIETWQETIYPDRSFSFKVKGTATETVTTSYEVTDASVSVTTTGTDSWSSEFFVWSDDPVTHSWELDIWYASTTATLKIYKGWPDYDQLVFSRTETTGEWDFGKTVSGTVSLATGEYHKLELIVTSNDEYVKTATGEVSHTETSTTQYTREAYSGPHTATVNKLEGTKTIGTYNPTPTPQLGGTMGPTRYSLTDVTKPADVTLNIGSTTGTVTASTSYSEQQTHEEQREGSAQGGPISIAKEQEYQQDFLVTLQPQHGGSITDLSAALSDDSNAVETHLENVVYTDPTVTGTVVAVLESMPPQTQMNITGRHIINQENKSFYLGPDAQIELMASDFGSGVAWTKYRIDSGAWQIHTQPISVADRAEHVLEFYSADRVGNQEQLQSWSFSGGVLVVDAGGGGHSVDLTAAVNAVADGEVVLVKPGRYRAAIDFGGKTITVRGSEPNDPAAVVIDGDLDGDPSTSDGPAVCFQQGEGPGAVLADLTITGAAPCGILCKGAGPTISNCIITGNHGSGMWNKGSSNPTVTNCTFSGNSAMYGGGMHNWQSSPTLINCTFSGNSSDENGGGMYNWHSSPTLTNCTFMANTAYDGGGMYSDYYSSLTVTNCTFSGNSAASNGGGMLNVYNSSTTVTDCTFTGNSAIGSGGGMHNIRDSNQTVTNSIFSENSANYGGGMRNDLSTPMLSNCTFTGNHANSYGGGMDNADSSPTVTGCAFSGNSASDGGGMENSGNSSPTMTNCTFTGNSAIDSGGGMCNRINPNCIGCSPTVTNCTFSGNSAAKGGGMYNILSSPTVTDCTFTENSAVESGGGMYNRLIQSRPTVTNCTFRGNSSTLGGGMYNREYSSPTVTNCTFIGNSAGSGGGMTNYCYCDVTVTNCILWANTAATGADMYNCEYPPTVVC